MSQTFSAIVLVALLGVAMANHPHHEILPHRGDAVSTTGSTNAASGYVGPSYSSALHSAPLAEGTNWQTNTIWWVGVGTANSVEVDLGDYVCDISEIVLQADVNDNSYVDYWANGQWNAIQFGACAPGSSICSNTGGGMRTKTVTGLSLTGVSKFRTYALTGDPNIAVSRLNAKGLCTPTGILPASSHTVSVTGSVNGDAPYTGAGSGSDFHHAMQAEGTHWQSDTVWWSGTGTDKTVVVDLDGTCSISKMILQADTNDQYSVDYWANGQWNAIPFGYCRTGDNRPGICTSYGSGMRTHTLDNLNVAGATRLRTYCTAGDNLCSVSRLFAIGACIPNTQDPAVAAFCDDIESKCTAMDSECVTLRSLNHIPVQSPNVLNPTNRHLYRLVATASTARTFAQFRAAAQAIGPGWDLATFSNLAELTFVRDNLVTPHYSGGTQAYTVGAFDSASNGWRWIDGSSVPMSMFGGSEPNNHNSYLPDYPIAGMDNRFNFLFNDYLNENYCVGASPCYVAGFIAEKHTAEPDSEIPDDCDGSVAACNAIVDDCRDKAANCAAP